MEHNYHKQRQWWRVPLLCALRGKSPWMTATVLFWASLLVPQLVQASSDYKSWYPFKDDVFCDTRNGEPYIGWTTVLFNNEGADEGFFEGEDYHWGVNVYFTVGNTSEKYEGNLCCNSFGYGRRMYNTNTRTTLDEDWPTKVENTDSKSHGGYWSFGYGSGTDGKGDITYIKPRWFVPFELRNTNIKVRLKGRWYFYTSTYGDYTSVDKSQTIAVPYTFTVRGIEWDGSFSVDPDGNVTIPYKFSSTAGNTDGRTHICTRIAGQYCKDIATITPSSDYSAGTYKFKLSEIGKDFRSSFNIEPYHEFSHENDKDNNNKTKNYTASAGTKYFGSMPKATINKVLFDQSARSVKLSWTADNGNYQTGNWGTKWAIYRNDTLIATVSQDTFSYEDKDIANKELYETNVKYTIYYLWKDWPEKTKLDILKSNEMTVNTKRTMPINEMNVVSKNDRIVITWKSDSYPLNWGHKFKIFIDKETDPVITITPTANQTNFTWEHRSVDPSVHQDRQNKTENGIPYTEEPLNGCVPHTYHVVSYIDNKKFSEEELQNKAIQNGSNFYSLEATKGSYAGMVKLSWSVNHLTKQRKYNVERRTANNSSDSWLKLHSMTSTDDYLFYTDDTVLPGIFYEYRVTMVDICDSGDREIYTDKTDIGFSQTVGTVSGRITYGASGSSVEGVEVLAEKASSSSDDATQYNAMRFTADNAYVTWEYPDKDYAANHFRTGDFSIQLWMLPETFHSCWFAQLYPSSSSNDASVAFSIQDATGTLLFCDGTQNVIFDSLKLMKNEYNHVVVTRKGTSMTCYLMKPGADGLYKMSKQTKTCSSSFDKLNNAKRFDLGIFKGYVDEFRLWTKCLTENEIMDNYDHLLVGNEKGLETYWTFDEGLGTQFFDYSREGTVYHQHHGKAGSSNVKADPNTPKALKLKAKTDKDGNYIIQGIPFKGDGTNYNIRPTKDSHQFSPEKQSRFISASSLVQNSVDFTDVSSFEVSGKVLFAGTNIPVDSVYIYVDGSPVSRNGEAVVTNIDGEFVVDVPIGKHYISAVKDGHTFVDDGRIPADPSGLNKETYEFVSPLSGLRFIDNTLVPVIGRVVGGDIEGSKPLGFGLSKNNIGKAEITLEEPDTRYMLNAEELMDENNPLVSIGFKPVKTNTELTYPEGLAGHGQAYRTGGEYEDNAKRIVITTDAETGEFRVMLPPLDYKVVSVKMVNNDAQSAYVFDPATLPRINASDPTTVLQDSVEAGDGTYLYYDYVASFKQTKHTNPVLEVTQNGARPGVFGMDKSYYVNPITKQQINVDLYKVAEDGTVTYNYGYPIFAEMGSYTFNLEGYENYTNYEKGATASDRVTKVPLKGVVVTISNALSSNQEVYNASDTVNAGQVYNLKTNQLMLDSLGKAKYVWKAGLPNIQDPYYRKVNMTYNNGAGDYSWEGFYGIIFGDLPSGTNFTTLGPSEVEMILHDPYGDSSFATWESGTVTVQTIDSISSKAQDNDFMTNIHGGFDVTTSSGTILSSVQDTWDVIIDISSGFERTTQNDTINSTTTTLEVTRAISTSSDPDFVGADGDLYIGKSSNLLFGNSRSVGLKIDANNKPYVGVDDAIIVGKKFETNFVYTQYNIENVLIPNMKRIRDNLLIPVDSATYNDKNLATDTTIYITLLPKTDENFGEPNTYKMIAKKAGLDEVGYYNDQIKYWQKAIADNEEFKVKRFEKGKPKNVSFGGGSEYSETVTSSKTESLTTSFTHNWTYVFSFDGGLIWNGIGLDLETTTNTTWEGTESETNETTETSTFSFTLADSGPDDSFSMDIYEASDNHGPIFRTVGGQSSCPYEDQVLTKYYLPGEKELSTATWKIEDPEIVCDDNLLTGVPTGGKAQFELKLKNNSITNTDCYFELVPLDGTNEKGAKLSLPTGPIGNGRTVKVPAGETVKMTLTLEQGSPDITKYEDVQLALRSTCQEDIASTVSLSAEFVPASTPVNLTIDKSVVNITNVDEGLMVRMTGFNRNFAGLQRVDLQYIAPGTQTWSLVKSYIPSDSVRADDGQVLLPANGVIELPLDMKDAMWIKDGTYQFRAQSSTMFGGKQITYESDVLIVEKDLVRPQLFGYANPSDGILSANDEISLTFNEDIQKDMLTKNNIVVSGALNGAKIQHDVALKAQGTDRAAYTEATYNLEKKDFSADMWVRVTNAGDIFTHGNGDNKFKVSVNTYDNLVVTIGDKSYTSEKSFEKDTWTFLAFSYNYESGNSRLSARTVTANGSEDMFFNLPVADYTGTGGIILGQNFSGAINELSLWDKARDMQEAQAEMYYTKKPSTPNLIGYWKMDEGIGTEIRDYARNRHMTMPNNTSWYLNNDNKAVSLSDNKTLKLNIAECSVSNTEDYAIEMWFKGAKADQNAASTLFYTSETSVGMGFNDRGLLTMMAKGSNIVLSNNNYLDNAWHHIALNVLRNGNATVYVDGVPVKTVSASAVPQLEGAFLYVGSKGGSDSFFKGTVDEIRIWKASMTGDLLKSLRTQRLNGNESGLVAYYSFEKLDRNSNNGIISSVGSTTDLCTGRHNAEMSDNSEVNFVNEAPAMKVKPEATNVEYSYVANERSIIISLNETPARLEGTTLQFTVNSVRDLYGNESSSIMWTAYVRQNNLLWKGDTDVTIEKKVGETASFDVSFVNESGNSENWSLSGLPSWLTATATNGTLKATLSKTITFTIDESTPVGKYEQTIYLTGNNNISEPLTLYLKVKAEEPDWAVNASDYELSMNIIGNVQILNVPSQNEDDIVAAFVGNECRGVAHPLYNNRYDGYFVTMDIYGKSSENEKANLEFKIFEAATGIIYPVVKVYQNNATEPSDILFKLDTFYGRFQAPLILSATDEVEQSFDLANGWNWMSFGVKPGEAPDYFFVEDAFAKAGGKVKQVKSRNGYAECTISGDWIGIDTLRNSQAYLALTRDSLTLTVSGHRVDATATPVTLHYGWNWIGYHRLQTMSIAKALSDWKAEDDDIIKGQKGVAYYDGFEWVGSLKTLVPGQGYMASYKLNTNDTTATTNFCYPTATGAGSNASRIVNVIDEETVSQGLFTPVDYHSYPRNMVLFAKVVNDGEIVSGAELGVFAGNECREADMTDEKGMVYITIPGDEPVKLNFRVAIDGTVYNIAETIYYESDAIIGSPRSPYIIDLGTATGIYSINNVETAENYYDLQGRKIQFNSDSRKLRKGVYIINGQKKVK